MTSPIGAYGRLDAAGMSRLRASHQEQQQLDAASGGAASSARHAGEADKDAAKIKVAQQFEAIFVRQLLSQMNATAAGEGGGGSEITSGMTEQAMADHISQSGGGGEGGFGIARCLLRHWGVEQP